MHTYIASQAAIAADCYQAGLGVRTFALGTGPTTPNVFVSYPGTGNPYATGAVAHAGQRFSYFNARDWALHESWTSWERNNDMKPDSGWGYVEGDNDVNTYDRAAGDRFRRNPNTELLFDADRFEIFSYIAEARFSPFGVQPTMNDFNSFNLQSAPLNYNEAHYSHSRQFRSNIIDERSYWTTLKTNCGF